jgi:putative hydrolase of the HAD superfamily
LIKGGDMIKCVIFDVGNVCYPYTLNPLNDYLFELTTDKEQYLLKNGIKSFNYNSFMKGEISYSDFCKELCEYAGVTYLKENEIAINEKMLEGVGEFFEETLDVINDLKNNGIRVCLLSNALPNLSHTAEALAVKENIFVSYELGMLKPDIKIYKKVLDELGIFAQEIVFIDDKEKNVKAAQDLGIKGIVFDKDTIKKELDIIIKNA